MSPVNDRAVTLLPKNIIVVIVRDVLGLAILDTRHQDGLDFHEVPVWALRMALHAACMAGVTSVEQ